MLTHSEPGSQCLLMMLPWQQQQEVVRFQAAVQCWNGAKSQMGKKNARAKITGLRSKRSQNFQYMKHTEKETNIL